uniref:Aspartate--tRNA ligase, cytoplasmic n=1 Tax=Zeugodacus cucurbitae TaxID=28588 RepID=A0A0A1WWN0_ZEUCU
MRFLTITSFFAVVALSTAQSPLVGQLTDVSKLPVVSKLPIVGDLTKPLLSNVGDLPNVADVSKLPVLSKLRLPGDGLKLSLLSKEGLANLKLGGTEEQQVVVADDVNEPVKGDVPNDGDDSDFIVVRRRDWRARDGLRRPRFVGIPRTRNNVRIPRLYERNIRYLATAV